MEAGMLLLGVDISEYSLEVTAMSGGFAFLKEKTFRIDDKAELSRWIFSMLLEDYEPVSWFFCENNFYKAEFASRSFPHFGSHSYFLIKDRLVLNLYHVCHDLYRARCLRPFLTIPYILAASRRFFDEKYITLFTEESPLPSEIE
jgi:hypothetical protein